jgi:ABC-type multidrug transport system permease subunit
MKENIYQTERGLMAWGYAMFLLFAMICVVILSIAVKYWRVRKAF